MLLLERCQNARLGMLWKHKNNDERIKENKMLVFLIQNYMNLLNLNYLMEEY